jgi:hypothetical protein
MLGAYRHVRRPARSSLRPRRQVTMGALGRIETSPAQFGQLSRAVDEVRRASPLYIHESNGAL